jgi:hypothetical protein
MSTWVFDMETLPNATLFRAMNVDTGERFNCWRHEPDAPARLRAFVSTPGGVFIGFNSLSFDNVVCAAFCAGRGEADIKRIANDLIENRLPYWQAYRKYNLPRLNTDTIDLIEVAPSFVGLKAYGARMHMPLLQDMPLAHDQPITPAHYPVVESYCDNDLLTTAELLKRLELELALRIQMSRQYGVDMRSKSDSQMAEQAYITALGLERGENRVPASVTYTPPGFIRFRDSTLSELLSRVSEHVFEMNPGTGHVRLPDFLGEQTVKFGTGEYQLGVGGIHSTHDKSVCHVAGDDVICDIDAASFYPSIILECGFVPEGLGQRFIDQYRQIYERRLEAKRTGDKATNETLKIALNGTFGKLASKYSVLYAPDLMLAVTLTGQFTLLMLIEWLEAAGAVTLSANTDGIAVRYPRDKEPLIQQVVSKFSEVSRFNFEFTPYRVLAMKDVNNYFAVKTDRKLKNKGIYAELSLKKNASAQVCADAVGAWLAHGTPLLETISAAPFQSFVSARNVTGGGQQNGRYLGKVVRWYQSSDRSLEPIRYVSNGNLVPKTEGARACMQFTPEMQRGEHPPDLDISWYRREAVKIAQLVGCESYLTAEELELITPIKKERKRKNATPGK